MLIWELTDKEKTLMSPEDIGVYNIAEMHMQDSHACGPDGGWRRGMDLLKGLGWTEEEKEEHGRIFTTMVKPAKYSVTMVVCVVIHGARGLLTKDKKYEVLCEETINGDPYYRIISDGGDKVYLAKDRFRRIE